MTQFTDARTYVTGPHWVNHGNTEFILGNTIFLQFLNTEMT